MLPRRRPDYLEQVVASAPPLSAADRAFVFDLLPASPLDTAKAVAA